ncbi:lysylphosphatidylglycerol synthase domain-containing protein [Cognatilysobacter lacus]|nr:lysylphosphatidylglycerol synthase domain-containing protein [Lysobacter lacus]
MKYLPGKYWGTAFQLKKTADRVGMQSAVHAAALHMAVSTIGSVLVYSLASGGMPAGLAGSVCVYAWLTLRLRGDHSTVANALGRAAPVMGALILEWCFFWWACMLMLPGLAKEDALKIGALYSLAWVCGGVLSLMPGGLVVRESAFVVLAQLAGVDPGTALAFSVSARVCFTMSEFLAAAAGWVLGRRMKLV